MYRQLVLKIFQGIKSVAGIKVFTVFAFAMRPFHFAVVTLCIRAYFVVGNAIGLPAAVQTAFRSG